MAHHHSSSSSSSSSTGSMDSMSSSNMAMTFFASTHTPLFSTSWSPTTAGAYAGTCIFLVLLGTLFRSLFALRSVCERRWLDRHLNRRFVVVAGQPSEAQRTIDDADVKAASLLTERGGVEEEVRIVKRHARAVMPWRLSVDLPRAMLASLTAAVGYLLMLAVMTFNVGYFLSVLAGTFLGELLVGRYAHSEE
ncbi:MAG: hypothetical protein M1837_005801 [Sclerophora amabilis]|nr:MAG: hypothetical protein M1837_005801 [Sclerophora amabilis]